MMSLSRNQSTPENGKESLSLMKQWIFAKFSGIGDNEGSYDNMTDDRSSASVPKIVISGGSEGSLNKIQSTPPTVAKRPSPLTKTWSTDSRSASPSSVPNKIDRSFWYNFISKSPKPSTHCQTNSLPCTPMETTPEPTNSSRPVYSADGFTLRSPVFRFSQKYTLPQADGHSLSGSHTWSRSQLDSPSICGACGQRKYYGSRDFVGFDSQQHLSYSAKQSCSNLARTPTVSKLGLRRTSSCRVENDKNNVREMMTARIIKAASHVDVQKQRTTKSRRIKRTGSREKSKSTISLTRSWSINLDSFRIVRNDSAKSDTNSYSRKMSLNDNELRRINDRRRSSLLRLICIGSDRTAENDDDVTSVDTEIRRNSTGDVSEYSPKVTRSDKFVSGDPVDDFRSTFETDSIRIPSIYGQVKIMFQYFNAKEELHVTLLKGSNVARSLNGKLGLYTKVCLMPGKIQLRGGEDKHDTHDPVFYELFVFKMTLGELLDRQLRVKMYNKPGIFSIAQPVGEFSLPLYSFDLTAVTVIWQNMKRCRGQKVRLETKYVHNYRMFDLILKLFYNNAT